MEVVKLVNLCGVVDFLKIIILKMVESDIIEMVVIVSVVLGD